MITVIDNYDSFTYNLVQCLGELGADIIVLRNDVVTASELREMNPSHIVISPGPGTPDDAGVSKDVIRVLGSEVPILGVCLGHQCIGESYGGTVKRAERQLHGKVSDIYHFGDGIFIGVPTPFKATRYHSLIVADELPEALEVTAFTRTRELMGVKHREYPVYGIQFHPESFLTIEGKHILQNFLEIDHNDNGLSHQLMYNEYTE